MTEKQLKDLTLARIPYVTLERGILNGFEFRFQNYYWVVTGKMPLSVAEKIYADPLGKAHVRAGGHCMKECPTKHIEMPDVFWVKWQESLGLEPLTPDNVFRLMKAGKSVVDTYNSESLKALKVAQEIGIAYVELYHVDSLAGLRLIADYIREL